ncbi:MAG: hypothetical protein P0Y48_08665 [Candidatus Microbacterium phytovorans]|uniref:Uncharacterized protein n=1 Tax=Candidatus Microbacterium phytovorans TaxID=3121374 RepID=A0AAJ5VYD5_9MICO|nr:hypothetical protein [Microbacterium sp.]WEK12549.1 MAG: hypothetical protein P0Y48_08665 [Microbacterium sp.]
MDRPAVRPRLYLRDLVDGSMLWRLADGDLDGAHATLEAFAEMLIFSTRPR